MASNVNTLMRAGASIINESLQGKKRWISLLAYLLLAISTVAGFQLDALARDDPRWLQQIECLLACDVELEASPNPAHDRHLVPHPD